ncbi:hypothetical protein N7326_04805 [Corynebacterium sp. ES2794-CONJ1]|uniref:hypothetical protein n=1 Tax=unclassified Corynebacterium TaxID=2624378 RepID=UPI002169F705|nr:MULTISPECIES: hypothetical protein [unclassified Corynebacterium]MCS4489946.1 hypothetical protein [Corynebacterium sp. ES2775-CONJ]MCS4491691.1 hypothetical protein [Corynebacterium sp. ES2715-CONJ3]MCS4531796.1 hypothetical protein [Corynebacterium sp. ES2730-CONJ]MCU9519192.1 hypothetical protein [Corynebacterium sp. ES2794-CONJ1]
MATTTMQHTDSTDLFVTRDVDDTVVYHLRQCNPYDLNSSYYVRENQSTGGRAFVEMSMRHGCGYAYAQRRARA